MRLDKLTVKSAEALQSAQGLAERRNHQAVDVEHLLMALLGQKEGIALALLKKLIETAEREAEGLKDEYVSVEHLLMAMGADDGETGRIFREFGITKDKILAALVDIRGAQRVTDQNPEEKYQALQKYSRDLTDLARKGKLDPVIGRDEEIR